MENPPSERWKIRGVSVLNGLVVRSQLNGGADNGQQIVGWCVNNRRPLRLVIFHKKNHFNQYFVSGPLSVSTAVVKSYLWSDPFSFTRVVRFTLFPRNLAHLLCSECIMKIGKASWIDRTIQNKCFDAASLLFHFNNAFEIWMYPAWGI